MVRGSEVVCVVLVVSVEVGSGGCVGGCGGCGGVGCGVFLVCVWCEGVFVVCGGGVWGGGVCCVCAVCVCVVCVWWVCVWGVGGGGGGWGVEVSVGGVWLCNVLLWGLKCGACGVFCDSVASLSFINYHSSPASSLPTSRSR